MKISPLLILLMLLSGWIIMLPEPALAQDIQINCDLRVLQLTDAQRDQIRQRRQLYKSQQRQSTANANATHNQNFLRSFFNKSAFDNQQASEIAKQRYANEMRQTIAELNFYHDVYQLLDDTQRETWLQQCSLPTHI